MTASNFNLQHFLGEFQQYNKNDYTAASNGRKAMEEREIEIAQKAVNNNEFLSLTLGDKLTKLGVGERVVKQIGDTAVNTLKSVVDPINDYLEKYENIFDQNVYNAQIQSYGKQMYFAHQELSKETLEDPIGQNFVYTM